MSSGVQSNFYLIAEAATISKPGQIARKTSETCQIFRARTFCLLERKKSLDLQIYSRIGKTIKKLLWIPNNLVNISVLVIFWCLYIWWRQDCFICLWIVKHWTNACVRQVRGEIRALQTSMMVLSTKVVRNINLKTLTTLAKRLILVAWLSPGRVFVDGHTTVPKIETEICKDGKWLKMESF